MVPPNPETHALTTQSTLDRVRTLSYLLDNSIPIPGTSYRVGLDPLLGLVPGGGDTVGMILSAYIVMEGIRLRLPRESVTRMVSNLLLDAVLGTVPLVGDVFDATWKANSRNLALLEAHVQNPEGSRSADRWFLFLMAMTVIGIVFGFVVLVATVIRAVTLLLVGAPTVG